MHLLQEDVQYVNMIEEGNELYASLEAAIEACSTQIGPPIAVIECCFQAASHYWDLLKIRLNGYAFPSEAAEIFFFRNIKPLFTSAIEYYGLLAYAQLFKDSEADAAVLQKFFCRERQRLDKFAAANHDFYQYYKSGATDFDDLWFVRANNDGGNFVKAKPHDIDSAAATRYDYLISSILALEKYVDYLCTAYGPAGSKPRTSRSPRRAAQR